MSEVSAQPWTKNFDYVDDNYDGLAKVGKGQKVGFVNDKGKVIVQLLYDDACKFSDGLAAVKQGNKWGYIDSTGAVVIPFEFNEAYSFNEGLAKVARQERFGLKKATRSLR
jgi:hypothetical protein